MREYDFGSKALPARRAPLRRTEQAGAAMQRPLSAASVTALQPTVGNRAVGRLIQREEDGTTTSGGQGTSTTTVQRKKFTGQPPKVVAAKAQIKQSLNAKTAKECTARLAKRFPKGPLFSDNDVAAIKKLSVPYESQQWLQATGIGTTADAFIYLRAKDFKGWLKLSPGRRLLAATLAWKHGMGKNDPNPPPPYTLGRAMAIQSGNLAGPAQKQAEQERDEHIRGAFVNTLMPADPAQKHAANDNAAVLRNAQAQQILTKILLILRAGLKVYDKNAKDHVDFKEGDVVRALAHGGRVNIRIPALAAGQTGYELTDWLGITEQVAAPATGYVDQATDWLGITQANARSHVPTDPVKERGFGTHHMDIGENKSGPGSGTFKETGGKKASASNKVQSNVTLFGMDLAAGGIGNKDFNGDVIMPDGGHGHMFIGLTTPTPAKDGALQIGIETTGPGADSLVGYKHNWQSTEATANPESSVYGHKMHKVGEGKLSQNQRLVDLNELQSSGKDWLTRLDELEADWNTYLAWFNDKRQAYEGLVSPRL